MNFKGKILWVTGASSGIGRAVAIELSTKKCHLILSSRNKKKLENVAALCNNNGSTTDVVPIDLSDSETIKNAGVYAIKKYQKIHGLYHFSGISQRSLANETDIKIVRQLFEINFFGIVELTKAVLPAMIKNGGGQIGVTTSIVGKFGFLHRSSYAATKHALQGFFESLRAENVSNNILVSIIIPGRVKTNISLNALNKHGKTYNKTDKGLQNGMLPDKAAKQIVKQLQNEKKEILVGGKELLMVYIRRFVPKLFYYLVTKIKD